MSTRFVRPGTAPSPVLDWSAPFEALTEGVAFVSRGRTITESDVVQFAALTGDFHPLHTDAHFAASGPFGERVAHGMLTISYAVGLVPLDPARVLALRRIGDVVFKRPVKLGQTIHVEGSLTGLSPISEEAGIVSFAWRIKDAHGALLTRASVDVLWATDHVAEAAEPEPVVDPDALHPAGAFCPVPL
ncbi:MAG: dehydratase [Solirubrobacterales bacterium]|nr:dehydratase [Solirubrobacterales bacterium]